jgi:methylmalonyl-CoA mutase cobalamin-binding subunit
MYNIKQAAARAGVTVPVLRAWERRYGIVHPDRSSSGYRQFDDAAIARVRTMRLLVDAGWSPSAAAAAILAGTAPLAPTPAQPADDPVLPNAAAAAGAAAAESTVTSARFVDAARAMDPTAVGQALDDIFTRGSFEPVATRFLFPALQALGEAWARGDVTVGAEHMASNAVQRRLAQALEAAGSIADPRRRVVVGLPPGSRHELGALAFAVAARRAGLDVTYLGADLPVDDWVRATAGAGAAVIGVVAPRDRGPALEVARRLRVEHPGLVVALGGRAAQRSVGFLVLPDDLAAAAAAVTNAMEPPVPA